MQLQGDHRHYPPYHTELEMDDLSKYVLHHRGVNTPCVSCKGLGVIWYNNTATWHGGMGGASMTQDVCNKCWGSGDAENHWTDLRKLRNEENHRVAVQAAELFAYRCGVAFRSVRPGLRELIGEIERFGRGRKKRAEGFDTACICLAKLLTELVDAEEKKVPGK
jgi:hypothetical protein